MKFGETWECPAPLWELSPTSEVWDLDLGFVYGLELSCVNESIRRKVVVAYVKFIYGSLRI